MFIDWIKEIVLLVCIGKEQDLVALRQAPEQICVYGYQSVIVLMYFALLTWLLLANYSTINEKELFTGLSNGNETAFTQLFVHYSRILFPFITQLLRSAELSEEIIQQTFLKLWLNREKLADVENPNAYIFRIAANECYAHLRKNLLDERLFSTIKISGINDSANITEEQLTAKEIRQLIHQAVNQLPAQQKRIYNLSRSQLLKIPEIARLLDLSPITVKNSLVKSLKSIREHLKNSEYYLPVILLIIFL